MNKNVCPELSELAYDAKQFMLENRSMMKIALLQVYFAALLFSPERSLVRKQYEQKVPCIIAEPKVIQEWSP